MVRTTQFYSPVRVAAVVVLLAAALTLALLPLEPARSLPDLGEAAPAPVRAEEPLRYESEELTERARAEAADAVPLVLELDFAVRAAQQATLTALLAEIESVQGNSALPSDERQEQLARISGLAAPLPQLLAGFLRSQWEAVKSEADSLLTAILSRNVLREDVDSIREGIRDEIGPGLSSRQIDAVAALVAPLLRANVTVDEAAVARDRQDARDAVAPVIREFEVGDLIVAAGVVVDAEAAEAIALLPEEGGGVPVDDLIAMLILALLSGGAIGGYLWLARPVTLAHNRRLVLVGLLLVAAVAAARWYFPLVLPDEHDKALELVLPLGAAALITAALLDNTLALVVAAIVAALVGAVALVHPDYGPAVVPDGAVALRPALALLFSGVAGVFAVRRVERVTHYGFAGAVVGATLFAVGLSFWLLDPDRATAELGWLALVALSAAVATGILTLGAFAFLGFVFGIPHPPATLGAGATDAAAAAPAAGGGARYLPSFHARRDDGRTGRQRDRAPARCSSGSAATTTTSANWRRPHMYVENQTDGTNPHDDLDPLESAQVIQEHVQWGLELARRHRLPEHVRAFILEHHGTRLVTYFYRKAALTEPEVDPALFVYDGPRPQSRETAIAMLADSCEAVVRSSRRREPETIDSLIDGVLAERLSERQLDESDLTLRDLRAVGESFKLTLRGVYHPRIEYPAPSAAERRAGRGHAAARRRSGAERRASRRRGRAARPPPPALLPGKALLIGASRRHGGAPPPVLR